MIVYIVATLISYLLGTVNTALIVSSAKKKDLRSGGSGNLGASNATLLLGWKWGVFVGACDMLKGFLPVFVARMFFADYTYLPYVVATAAILGHIFPFYHKFKGGKGFATLFGCILGFKWYVFLIAGVVTIIITLISDYIVLATLTVIISYPIYVGISTHNVYYALIIGIASVVIFIKHIENYKRIIKKEEIGIRASFTKKHRI